VSGFELVRAVTGLDRALATCDLVLTGEGSFDDQSLRGKAVGGVAALARERGVPCVVLAGRVGADPAAALAAGVSAAYSLVDHAGSARATRHAAEALRSLATRIGKDRS
jgi:glycerate kinase